MVVLMEKEKEKEKAPSKKLKEKIHACVYSFQKLGAAVNEALEQGREEGFTDKEIGKMIREEMLQAGFDRSTVAGYLPSSAKQKPRGKPVSGNKISRKNLQTEAVVQPELPQFIFKEEDVLAIDDIEEQKQRMDAVENTPIPQPSVVDIQRVIHSEGNIESQSAITALDPEDEYNVEHLEKYSRGTLENIVKWQHRNLERLQEGYNEGTSWKSKYMKLKAAYKKATGRDWVD